MLNLRYFSRRAGGGGLLLLVLLVLLLLVVLILVLRVVVCQAPHLVLQVPYRSQVLHLLLEVHVIEMVIVLEHCNALLVLFVALLYTLRADLSTPILPGRKLNIRRGKSFNTNFTLTRQKILPKFNKRRRKILPRFNIRRQIA